MKNFLRIMTLILGLGALVQSFYLYAKDSTKSASETKSSSAPRGGAPGY